MKLKGNNEAIKKRFSDSLSKVENMEDLPDVMNAIFSTLFEVIPDFTAGIQLDILNTALKEYPTLDKILTPADAYYRFCIYNNTPGQEKKAVETLNKIREMASEKDVAKDSFVDRVSKHLNELYFCRIVSSESGITTNSYKAAKKCLEYLEKSKQEIYAQNLENLWKPYKAKLAAEAELQKTKKSEVKATQNIPDKDAKSGTQATESEQSSAPKEESSSAAIRKEQCNLPESIEAFVRGVDVGELSIIHGRLINYYFSYQKIKAEMLTYENIANNRAQIKWVSQNITYTYDDTKTDNSVYKIENLPNHYAAIDPEWLCSEGYKFGLI